MRLEFEKGTISAIGEYNIPHTKWDDRTKNNRTQGFHYRDIIEYLENSNISYKDNVLNLVESPDLSCNIELRDYQRNALDRWITDKTGVLVMPTGSGKTYIGIKAIDEINSSTFIVVPTLDLVDQWKNELKTFNVDIGEYTGREKELKSITVSTYDSAYNNAENIGNKFKFLIFDEVHHLPSEGYSHIAEFFVSPYRMGLTATFERQDNKHEKLSELLGGKVYEIETQDLTGEYLSEYDIERIYVDLKPGEKHEYEKNLDVFKNYLKSTNIQMRGSEDFQKIVMRSGNDPQAWKAIRARNKARKIAYSSESKLEELSKLLNRHINDRIIIFTRYNDIVYKVSDRFFIPNITHKTDKQDRKKILKKFKNDDYSAIVSSQVLDEGVNVPDANVGIILSGTGSNREYRQRLGRILRPSGEVAKLYEVVSNETAEVRTSYRRKN